MLDIQLILVLCGIFYPAVTQDTDVSQESGLVSVSVGDNVTLHCFYNSNVAMHFSWYRQSLGGRLKLLFKVYKHDSTDKTFHLKQNSRYSVKREKGINHLQILSVQYTDTGTYYCGSAHSNVVEFGEGTFLLVKGTNMKQVIVQYPVSTSAQHGESVSLYCSVLHNKTCSGGSRVYWFTNGYYFVVTYDHQCNRSQPGLSSQSCVYHLQNDNLGDSDAGSYFCAVESCGEMLFANETNLEVTDGIKQIRILVVLSISRSVFLLCLTICVLVHVVKSRSV